MSLGYEAIFVARAAEIIETIPLTNLQLHKLLQAKQAKPGLSSLLGLSWQAKFEVLRLLGLASKQAKPA
jgi:hypothetical protein